MSLSAKAKQEMLRMETMAKFPFLIEITTPDNTVYRYANATSDIEYNNQTYEAGFFKITPSEKTESEIKDAKLTISSVDQLWIERIRTYQTRCKVRFLAVINHSDNTIEPIEDISYQLTNATWNDTQIEWTMKFDEWLDIKMPCVTLTSYTCPALF